MNQNLAFLTILPLPQRLLDPAPRPLKLAQQILVLDIINLNGEVLILLPVGESLEVEFEHRKHVRDARFGEGALAPQGENAGYASV